MALPEPLVLPDEPSENSDYPIARYDPLEALYKDRRDFAAKLFWLLAWVLAGGLVLVTTTRFTKIDFEDAKDLFFGTFTAVLAIVSSVVGYYFGRTEGERRS